MAAKILHEGYDPQDKVPKDDVAILTLEHDIAEFNQKIKPICLPTEDLGKGIRNLAADVGPRQISSGQAEKTNYRTRSYVNELPYVAGWGTTAFK